MRDLTPLLADILSREPGLRLALLFGSFAQGTAAPDSDVDVAVSCHRPPDAAQRMRPNGTRADRTERAVDLVALRPAGEPALGQLLKGRRPLGPESDYSAVTPRPLHTRWDFMTYIG